jgi:hypothetical protein
MEDRAGRGDASDLIAHFDARDAVERARLADILSETIHILDAELARSAPALPQLKADNPDCGSAGRVRRSLRAMRLKRRRRVPSAAP